MARRQFFLLVTHPSSSSLCHPVSQALSHSIFLPDHSLCPDNAGKMHSHNGGSVVRSDYPLLLSTASTNCGWSSKSTTRTRLQTLYMSCTDAREAPGKLPAASPHELKGKKHLSYSFPPHHPNLLTSLLTCSSALCKCK